MLPILINHIASEPTPQQIIDNIDAFIQQTPREIDFKNAKVWVHGVNIPFYDRSNRNWTDEADSRFYWYPGSGFYDVNKHYPASESAYPDDNMCWAGSASNALLWFLNTNNDEVQYYLKKHPYIKQTLPSYNFKQVGYDPIFNVFHEYYDDQQSWPTAGFQWFLNGIPSGGRIKRRSNLSFNGYFNDIFARKEVFTKTSRQPKKEAFNNFIKESLRMNRAIGFVAYLKRTGNHAMTFWGFEFDEEGNVKYAYEADNNEYNNNDLSFVRRRRVTYNNYLGGFATLMNTQYEWPITEVYAVDAQKAIWKQYIRKEEGMITPEEIAEEQRKKEEEERKKQEEERRRQEQEKRQREEQERRNRQEQERRRQEEERRNREEQERRQREEEERRQREEQERLRQEEERKKKEEEEKMRQRDEEEGKKKEGGVTPQIDIVEKKKEDVENKGGDSDGRVGDDNNQKESDAKKKTIMLASGVTAGVVAAIVVVAVIIVFMIRRKSQIVAISGDSE